MAKSYATLIFEYIDKIYIYKDDMFCVSSEKHVHKIKRPVFMMLLSS